MPLPDVNSTLKRLRNHYRLVIMNEDTFEEVVKFKLTRLSVYVVLSTIFILLICLTVALIVFTPLKYYLPGTGMGTAKEVKEYRNLKIRTDSMEEALKYQDTYLKNIEKVLQGKVVQLDTTKLSLPKEEVIPH
jgi:Sec-independent protein translocase protein TatA